MHSPSPHKRNKMYYYWIDVVGTCNLRCPTCAVGNFKPSEFSGDVNPTGLMQIEMYRQIIQKIKADDISERNEIHLYNWGEPLLHPKIDEIVSITKQAGYYCGLSSNLNKVKNLESVIKMNPDFFRISLSGFTQKNYEKTHRRGNIEVVKENMQSLRRYINKYNATTEVQVLYHVYKHNADDDLLKMAEYSKNIGFNLQPVWAYFMPVEKGIQLQKDCVSEDDARVIEMLAIDPRKTAEISAPFIEQDCNLRKNQTVINFDGSVQLCCGTYDRVHAIAPAFIEIPHDELQEKKYRAPICIPCMSGGLHVGLTYGAAESLDKIGNKALRENGSELVFNQMSEPHLKHRDKSGKVTVVELLKPPVRRQNRGLRKFFNILKKK